MDKEVRRELTIALGNILMLKLASEAREAGRISLAQFTVIATAMDILLTTYEQANPVDSSKVN
jgi:hypothetical protein